MGSTRITAPVGAPVTLRRQVLDIKEEIDAKPVISFALRKKLFTQLDAISSSIDTLKSKKNDVSEFTRAQIENDSDDLPPMIISLYGEIHDRAEDAKVQSKIKQVVEEASHLERQLELGNTKAVAAEVTKLKKHIKVIRDDHPSGLQDNLDKLTKVNSVAKRADMYLDRRTNNFASKRTDQLIRAHTLGNSAPPFMNQLNLLEIQKIHYGQEGVDKVGASELLDIAEAFYTNNVHEDVMERYHLLPPSIKRVCKERFAEVGITSPTEDFVKTAQALVATSDDLAFGKGLIPLRTPEELDQIFSDANASAMT